MDSLSDLPVKDTKLTDKEQSLIDKYFGKDIETFEGKTKFSTLKFALYSTVLFSILSNKYIDSVLVLLPYCSNELALLSLKVLLFFISFFILYYTFS